MSDESKIDIQINEETYTLLVFVTFYDQKYWNEEKRFIGNPRTISRKFITCTFPIPTFRIKNEKFFTIIPNTRIQFTSLNSWRFLENSCIH